MTLANAKSVNRQTLENVVRNAASEFTRRTAIASLASLSPGLAHLQWSSLSQTSPEIGGGGVLDKFWARTGARIPKLCSPAVCSGRPKALLTAESFSPTGLSPSGRNLEPREIPRKYHKKYQTTQNIPPQKMFMWVPSLRSFQGNEAQSGCFGWGGGKVYVEKVYVLYPSPTLSCACEISCAPLHLLWLTLLFSELIYIIFSITLRLSKCFWMRSVIEEQRRVSTS